MANDPIGYQKSQLYTVKSVRTQRVETFALISPNVSSGNPGFFVVDVDEVTGFEDTLYWFDGLQTRFIPSYEQISSMLAGTGNFKTTGQVRAMNSVTPSFWILSDISGKIAAPLPDDTESEDDGETILVDAAGNRYSIVTFSELAQSPYQ